MTRKEARNVLNHSKFLLDSHENCVVIYFDGNKDVVDLCVDFSKNMRNNIQNQLISQRYVFGDGVYYINIIKDGVFEEEFVTCIYSDKFPIGKISIDLEKEPVYEYTLECDSGVH